MTENCFQQIQSKINPVDLQRFVNLFHLALSGATTQSHKTVYETLRQIQSHPDSYIYFLYIFLNQNYDENIRYITGTTMKSALQRNCKQLHFQLFQKDIMKKALLTATYSESKKIKSIQNMLVSQLAICFEQVDWQLIYFLIGKVNQNTDILSLLCTIFQDLKHASQNHSYYEGAVATQVIMNLLKVLHQLSSSMVVKINLSQINHFQQEIKCLTQTFKLMKILTFNLPLKLSQYFVQLTNQVIIPFLKYMSTIFDKNNIQIFYNQSSIHSCKNLVSQFFELINEISETKCRYLLQNKIFLENFILYFPVNCEEFRRQFSQAIKIWTNTILQLLINDQPNQKQNNQQFDAKPLKLFTYIDVIISRVIVGCRFTKQDQSNILHQMQLQHNPYGIEESLNKQQQQEQTNFQTKHGRAHGSTLRKISITVIQKICQQYENGFWDNNKTFINELMKYDSDYKSQQTAIIFIGLVAQNCIQQIRNDAYKILQFLVCLENRLKYDIVLASTLWTFQKLIPSYIELGESKKFIYQLIYKIMGNREEYSFLQNSKNLMVKEAAVSLLDQLLSQQTDLDVDIVKAMLQCLIYALQTFTGRALFNVFKAITTIFSQTQRQPSIQAILVSSVMKRLSQKWVKCVDKDSIMCPLIECLSNICENRPKYFANYSLEILKQIYPLFKETHRKSLILRVIDLATAIIISAKQFPQSESYTTISQSVSSEQFLSTVNSLILSQEREIRNFGYGLLSDITKLNKISNNKAEYLIKKIAQSMDKGNSTSINNALMCLTDIIFSHQQIGKSYTGQTLFVITDFIFKFPSSQLPKIYLLNFSRMFGRLCLLDNQTSKMLVLSGKSLLKLVSQGLRSQQKSQLTLSAFNGLTTLLLSLQQEELTKFLQSKQIVSFIDSFMGYRHNSQNPDNMQKLILLLKKLKHIVESRNIQWNGYLNSTVLYPAVIGKIVQITK